MVSHTGMIWHYLGNFLLYTLLTVGILYGVYWYLKKSPLIAAKTPVAPSADPTPETPQLETESVLGLEPGKTLYVVRSGTERFLMATTADGIQLLSSLSTTSATISAPASTEASDTENTSATSEEETYQEEPEPTSEPAVEIPWFTQRVPANVSESDTGETPSSNGNTPKKSNGIGNRFLQSVQWLVSSRFK
jgi:hypothetical protein